jgi:hypothetical protein
MAVNKGLRRIGRALGARSPGQVMPDTNPACRTAFRSYGKIVRHPIGTLSGITPECCPPSVRNRVRHGAERATNPREHLCPRSFTDNAWVANANWPRGSEAAFSRHLGGQCRSNSANTCGTLRTLVGILPEGPQPKGLQKLQPCQLRDASPDPSPGVALGPFQGRAFRACNGRGLFTPARRAIRRKGYDLTTRCHRRPAIGQRRGSHRYIQIVLNIRCQIGATRLPLHLCSVECC